MKTMIRFFINKPKVVNLILISIFLLGTLSLLKTQNNGYPPVDFGMINITTVYPGASPEDIELKITNKIEEKLKDIDGIDFFNSKSIENISLISIKIEDTYETKDVESDINKAIDQIEDFPLDIKARPNVLAVDNNRIPVMEVAITGPADYALKRKYTLALERQLKSSKLIGTVNKLGYLDQEVKIYVDQKKLASTYTPLGQIINAIKNHNIRLPGGDLKDPKNEKKLIVMSEFQSAKEVGDVVIRSSFEGENLKISDVAKIKDGYETPEKLYRFQGKDAIVLSILKKTDSDMLKTAKAIENIVEQFKKTLPPTIQAEIVVDYSIETKSLLTLVTTNAKVGLILVLIALILFLNFKIAFWTAMGIPVSILIAFLFFPLFGITINFISLMAIIIVLGMLVDDAIVVGENIYRYREQGMEATEAAVKGTEEVAWPVIATVLTTIVAFSPLIAMTGIMGKFMFQMPIVVSLILIGSLLECLFILPSHIAHSKFKKKKDERKKLFDKLEKSYAKAVKLTVKHKIKTLVTFILIFLFSIFLLVTSMEFVLFDSSDGLYGVVEYETPRGTPLEETAALSKQIEDILLQESKNEIAAFVNTPGEMKPPISSHGNETNHSGLGNILIHLTPINSRTRTAKEVMKSIQPKLDKIKGFTRLEIDVMQDGPPVGRAINVTLISNNDEARNKIGSEMLSFFKEQPGTEKIENSEGEGKSQVQIKFNYELMSRLGLNPTDISFIIRTAYDGTIATTFRRDGEEVDFRVILNEKAQQNLNALKELKIANNNNKLVPIGQFITLVTKDDKLKIDHYDGDRSLTIYGDIDTKVNTSLKVNNALRKKFDPIIANYPDMRLTFGGEEKDTQEAMQSLFIAMILALLGIYFILVILFNSFSQPFLIMSCIPFSFSGIVFAFFIHNMAFGFVAIIGLIGLTGVVVNNSLIMISFINQIGEEKGITVDTIAEASSKRLRPILLTTTTTAAGLFPTAYGFAGDNAFLVPMIMAIAWGLVFASIITLFLIPSLYMLQFRSKVRSTQLKRKLFSKIERKKRKKNQIYATT